MNNQETFDTAARHLLTQKGTSRVTPNGTCAYRGEDGLKCAVGCLIPDPAYTYEMEGLGVDALFERFPDMEELFADVDTNLLVRLQTVHDSVSVGFWRQCLEDIAGAYGLSTAVLHEEYP